MDFTFLTTYMEPVIVGLCLCVGYIIKNWLPASADKYIPTIVGVLGALVAVWTHWPAVTPDVLLAGIVSGLASTGMHQAVKQLFGHDMTNDTTE